MCDTADGNYLSKEKNNKENKSTKNSGKYEHNEAIKRCGTLVDHKKLQKKRNPSIPGKCHHYPQEEDCLEKVAMDINNLLKNLKTMKTPQGSGGNITPQPSLKLEVQQREFFKVETAKKKSFKIRKTVSTTISTTISRNVPNKSNIILNTSRIKPKMAANSSNEIRRIETAKCKKNGMKSSTNIDTTKHAKFSGGSSTSTCSKISPPKSQGSISMDSLKELPQLNINEFIANTLNRTNSEDFPLVHKYLKDKRTKSYHEAIDEEGRPGESDPITGTQMYTNVMQFSPVQTVGNPLEETKSTSDNDTNNTKEESKTNRGTTPNNNTNNANRVPSKLLKKTSNISNSSVKKNNTGKLLPSYKTARVLNYSNISVNNKYQTSRYRIGTNISRTKSSSSESSNKKVITSVSKQIAIKGPTSGNLKKSSSSLHSSPPIKLDHEYLIPTHSINPGHSYNAFTRRSPIPVIDATKPKSNVTDIVPFSNRAPITRRPSTGNGEHSANLASSNSITRRFFVRNCLDPLAVMKGEVNRAIRERKTFTVRGHYPAVRRALLHRGWVEKIHPSYRDRLQDEIRNLQTRTIQELVHLLHVKNITETCKRLIKSKLLGSHQVDLYWGPNYDSFNVNSDKVKFTLINKFRRDVFSYTNKQGLSDAAKNAHWFNFPGLAGINHPRTYTLSKNGETKDFVKDFHRTAAISLLKWVVRSKDTKDYKVISPSGKIPLEAYEFAVNECYKLIKEANNEDIDVQIREAFEHEWGQFLEYFYKILHIGNHFKQNLYENEQSIVQKAKFILKQLEPHCPNLAMDGLLNIWILKPVLGSRGQGIHICRTLQYILQLVKNNPERRYIIQKYIERPLLIFNTKFDIRQWFLISNANPLTIWMYKDCYLRFSSQTYNLRKLHESIHLTNNSVQSKYKSTSHDLTLPSYNMWDSHQFKNHLSNIGYPEIYQNVIYKGMKEGIIAAVMMHQDKIDKRRNCFELYGADYMITEDFKPWLIEINSSPALQPSTPITSRMCPQVLEDVIKVIIDHARNNRANTGRFELVYRQQMLVCPRSSLAQALKLRGTPVPINYFYTPDIKESVSRGSGSRRMEVTKPGSITKLQGIRDGMRKTLENLLKFIQREKRQRKQLETVGTVTSRESAMAAKLSSCTSTTTSVSFLRLKREVDKVADNYDIRMTEQEREMIERALKMLRYRKKKVVMKYLMYVIDKILFKNKGEIAVTM